MVAKMLPSETLSPIFTFKSFISPAAGEGISTLDLSLSIVTMGSRFKVPLTDKQVKNIEYYKPSENSEEIKYLKDKRLKLGGFIPER